MSWNSTKGKIESRGDRKNTKKENGVRAAEGIFGLETLVQMAMFKQRKLGKLTEALDFRMAMVQWSLW